MARGIDLKKTKAEQLITAIYLEHPLWGAPKVHREVFARLRDKDDVYHEPNIDDPNWPRENTVYQHLRKIRKNNEARPRESKELDEPWTVPSLAKCPIPAEALPSVLRAWVYAREQLNIPLTIRQAQWTARLYAAIKDIPTMVKEALSYARFELIGELLGSGYESHSIGADLALFESMIGERLPLERRCRVLGVDIELCKRLGLNSDKPEPQLRKELTAGEAAFFTRDSIERSMKLGKVFHLAMEEVKSQEEWDKREVELQKMLSEIDPKLFKEFMEKRRKISDSKQSREKREAQNERKHKTKK